MTRNPANPENPMSLPEEYLEGVFKAAWRKHIPPEEYRAAIRIVMDFLGVVQQLRRPATEPRPAGRRKSSRRDRLLALLREATEPLTTTELTKHGVVSRTSIPRMLRAAGLEPVGMRGRELLWRAP